jgi:hypothetical protein
MERPLAYSHSPSYQDRSHYAVESLVGDASSDKHLLNTSSSVIFPEDDVTVVTPSRDFDTRRRQHLHQQQQQQLSSSRYHHRSGGDNVNSSIALAQVWAVEGEFKKVTTDLISSEEEEQTQGHSRQKDPQAGRDAPSLSLVHTPPSKGEEHADSSLEDLEESLDSFLGDIASVVHVENSLKNDLSDSRARPSILSASLNPLV